MFSNSSRFVIQGGSFYNIQQHDGPNNLKAHRQAVISILSEKIVPGAFHDSAERYPPPKCHPNTRQAVNRVITSWIEDTHRTSKILWINGPAGAGKSAIAQTIAEECQRTRRLAASFFFSRTISGRNDSAGLIATIAYQLIRAVPETKDIILETIENDPAIFSRSIATQMEILVVAPLMKLGAEARSQVIIIDGLDECNDSKMQAEIIRIIADAFREPSFPFTFLVASRPEPDIRDAFNLSNIFPLVQRITLDDTYLPDEDIEVFLRSRFADITRKHSHLYPGALSWPSDEVVRDLVKRSSGQFIYATTILKFIDSRHHDPDDRLQIIMGAERPDSEDETPFAELDLLYRQILATVPKSVIKVTLRILGNAMAFCDPISTNLIEHLLGLKRGSFTMYLSDLHSLVDLSPVTILSHRIRVIHQISPLAYPQNPPKDHRISLSHASFGEFLFDKTRSGEFFIDLPSIHSELTLRCLGAFDARVDGSLAAILVEYAKKHWHFHCARSIPTKGICESLLTFDLRSWLEVQTSLQGVARVLKWIQEEPRQFTKLRKKLIRRFLSVIDDVCISTLRDCPDVDMLLMILAIVQSRPLTTSYATKILKISPADLRSTLLKLQRLTGEESHLNIWFPKMDDPLLDFLADPKRAGPFFITPKVHAQVSLKFWRYITNTPEAINDSSISPALVHELSGWCFHTSRASPPGDVLQCVKEMSALGLGARPSPIHLDFSRINSIYFRWLSSRNIM